MRLSSNRLLTLGLPMAYLGVFFAIPLAIVLIYSVLTPGDYGGIVWAWSWEGYAGLLSADLAVILLRSLRVAGLATLICMVIGFPAAWFISQLPLRAQTVWMFLLSIPAWMNLLVKNYAWIVLLRREGLVNQVLGVLGVETPPEWLYHEGAVLLGLVHTYLPFMILPLYSALERLDLRLLEAARDLGANGFQVWLRVVLPQCAAGLWAGFLLVCIPAFGAFLTPDLLGGANSTMIGTLIQQQFLMGRNWPLGSAMSVSVMLLVWLALVVFRKAAGKSGEPSLI
ncbi:MAG: ABC transporter permease [Bacteroidia bacterium]|nr:ABC transporter permease [Bacteroidia bacterium]